MNVPITLSRVAGGKAEERFQQALADIRAGFLAEDNAGNTGKITITIVVERVGDRSFKVGVGDVSVKRPALKVISRVAMTDDIDGEMMIDSSDLDIGEQAKLLDYKRTTQERQ